MLEQRNGSDCRRQYVFAVEIVDALLELGVRQQRLEALPPYLEEFGLRRVGKDRGRAGHPRKGRDFAEKFTRTDGRGLMGFQNARYILKEHAHIAIRADGSAGHAGSGDAAQGRCASHLGFLRVRPQLGDDPPHGALAGFAPAEHAGRQSGLEDHPCRAFQDEKCRGTVISRADHNFAPIEPPHAAMVPHDAPQFVHRQGHIFERSDRQQSFNVRLIERRIKRGIFFA